MPQNAAAPRESPAEPHPQPARAAADGWLESLFARLPPHLVGLGDGAWRAPERRRVFAALEARGAALLADPRRRAEEGARPFLLPALLVAQCAARCAARAGEEGDPAALLDAWARLLVAALLGGGPAPLLPVVDALAALRPATLHLLLAVAAAARERGDVDSLPGWDVVQIGRKEGVPDEALPHQMAEIAAAGLMRVRETSWHFTPCGRALRDVLLPPEPAAA